MTLFSITEDPLHFRRCETCEGELLRVWPPSERTAINKHVGHRMRVPQWFSFWEIVRYLAGWL